MREVVILRWLLLISIVLLAVRPPLHTVRISTESLDSRLRSLEVTLPRGRQDVQQVKAALAQANLQLSAVMSMALSWRNACGISELSGCASRVQLWGERNSGTNALQYLMHLNFGIPHSEFFTFGHKHLFLNETNSDMLSPLGSAVARGARAGVPAVVIVREPLDWLAAMHKKPHHANHIQNFSLPDFLKSEWRSHTATPRGSVELSANILKLRSTKLSLIWTALNEFKNTTPFAYVRYEDLVEDGGVRTMCKLARELRLCPVTPVIRPLDKQVNKKGTISQHHPCQRACTSACLH